MPFSRKLTITGFSVYIDDQEIPIENGEAPSDNYNVLFYDNVIQVYSLREYVLGIEEVNRPYTLVEQGKMYFIIGDNIGAYPLEIKITCRIP